MTGRLWRGVLHALMIEALAGLLLFGAVRHAHAQEARQEYARITFYLPTGHVMRDGTWPYVGAAACDTYFPMGTVLELPDGFQVVCEDTGYLLRGQVDIFAPSMLWGRENVERAYGRFVWVNVLRWGWDA